MTRILLTKYLHLTKNLNENFDHHLDELRSLDFNLLSDQEYSEEEEAEAMTETMEQYMSKTRTDYGLGVAKPKIDNKDQFELKGQFLKEHRKTHLSHLDNHYCEDEDGNYGPKFIEAYRASHINNTIPRKEKDLRSFTLPCFINNTCFDNALVDLGASISVMPLLTYLNLRLGKLAHTKLTVELADKTIKYPKGIAENVLVGIGKFTFLVDFIILDLPEDIKVPLILKRPFLSIARAKIDVYKRKITLRTLVLSRSLDPFLEDYIELNDLNEPFELRRNQGDDLMPTIEEGALMNVPIFVGTFSIMTDFAVLEDMDAYRDEGWAMYQDRNALVLPIFYTGPSERNIDEVGGMHIFWNS
ncbi:hypothetical protein Tco_0209006, partial [Tanacetum coccineum]